ITKMAVERNEARRDEYFVEIGQYLPEQLVFVDESAVDRRTPARRFGWERRGKRARMHALSLDGILYSQIVEGSFNGESFLGFVTNLLDRMEPYPGRNSVLVMDNCAIHKVDGIRELVEERYVIWF
ncbi:hypothetical protein M407DRAFT_71694, partial [Tulasnella calospora MUT 4182]